MGAGRAAAAVAALALGAACGSHPAKLPPRTVFAHDHPGATHAGFAPVPRSPATLQPAFSSVGARGVGLAFDDRTDVAGIAGATETRIGELGMAAFDIDGDGYLDLVVPTGSSLDVYRNDGGMSFSRMEGTGLTPDLPAFATALGDCDGDGDIDLAVTSLSELHLFRNDGGTFTDVSAAAGVGARPGIDGSLLFFDADGDGDLDLFVACYAPAEATDGFYGCTDSLYINDGSCHFQDEAAARGITDRGFGLAVSAFDPNGDGATDLVVANDFGFLAEGNKVWMNDGTGHFTERADDMGLTAKLYGMGASVGDVDGDGILDVMVSNICEKALFLGQPDGHFRWIDGALGALGGWVVNPDGMVSHPVIDPSDPGYAAFMAFEARYMAHKPGVANEDCVTTWTVPITDLDADGHNEIFMVNGRVGEFSESAKQADMLFWSPHGNDGFVEVGAEAGLADLGTGRSALSLDLDGDGKLDLLVADQWDSFDTNPRVHAYRNVTPDNLVGHHLFVDLVGTGANTAGLGALVEVFTAGQKQVAFRSFGTSYLASSAAPLHFGLGANDRADVVQVRWPWGGGIDRFRNVEPGAVRLVQGTGR